MKRIAFFDLKGEPSIYMLEKSGGSYVLKDTVRVFIDGAHNYRAERPLEETDESYLSLPLDLLNFRIIELPFTDIERIREVLPFELDNLIMGGAEKVVFDVCLLKEDNEKCTVLAVYIMKDVLRPILNGLKALGIDAKIITSTEVALSLDSFKSGDELADLALKREESAGGIENRVHAAIQEVNRNTFNLRRGEFTYTRNTERTRKSLKLTAVLAVMVLLVFLSDMSLRIISTRREASAIRDETRKTYLSVFPNEKRVAGELYQLKAHIREMREKENSYAGIEPLPMLLDLAAVSGQGISFSELTMDQERLIIKGESPSLTDVQKLKINLERFLSGVNIADTKVSARNRTEFTITAKGRRI